ncbi:MAG: disulfide bond formation protein B [Alsobacter sp.]
MTVPVLTPARAAAAVAVIAAATVGGALFIEHGLGVKPCDLCLQQRIPYYAGTVLAAAAAALAARQPRRRVVALALGLLALLFLAGSVGGAYHAGVEWGLWAGPTGCTGGIARPAAMGDFLRQLETVKVVRCDEVAVRILGLSLAAWNALVALGLALLAAAGARAALPPGSRPEPSASG